MAVLLRPRLPQQSGEKQWSAQSRDACAWKCGDNGGHGYGLLKFMTLLHIIISSLNKPLPPDYSFNLGPPRHTRGPVSFSDDDDDDIVQTFIPPLLVVLVF